MSEQQYRVIADRDKCDDPTIDDIAFGDRVTFGDYFKSGYPVVVRIERQVSTTDEKLDERIEAWHYIADHPVFEQCYGKEQPLIDSMLERLNDLAHMESTIAELAPSVPTREQIAEALWREYRGGPYADWSTLTESDKDEWRAGADAVLALIQNGADR